MQKKDKVTPHSHAMTVWGQACSRCVASPCLNVIWDGMVQVRIFGSVFASVPHGRLAGFFIEMSASTKISFSCQMCLFSLLRPIPIPIHSMTR